MPTWIKEGCDHFGWATGASSANSVALLSGYTVSSGVDGSVTGPYGEPALRLIQDSGMRRDFGANYQEVHANFHLKIGAFSSAPGMISFYDGGTAQIITQILDTGALRITRNGTVLMDVPGVFMAGTWYFMQIRVRIASSGGVVIVRKNNVEIASYTGNTQATANAYTNRFLLHGILGTLMFPVFANLVMYSDVVSWPLKECRYQYGLMDAAGAHADFTPLASTNVSNVDEARPDSATTYNSSTVAGNKDSFGTNLSVPSNKEVLMVMEDTWARKTDAGDRTLRNLLRIGGTDFEGSDHALTPDFRRYTDIRSVSPATGVAWTPAELNALEKGYKDQA